MSKKANTAMIGTFVIGAAILAVVGVLAFGSGALFKNSDQFVLHFEGDVQGLTVGAPVVFRGVPVGQVKSIKVYYKSGTVDFNVPVVIETQHERFHEIETSSDQDDYVENIEKGELDRLIKAGLRGQLSLQSLVTGQLAVKLDVLPNTPVNLRGDGSMMEIPTVPSSFERLASALAELDLGKLSDNINRAMEDIGEFIDGGGLQELMNDFSRAAQEIANLAHELRGRTEVITDEFQMTAQTARSLMQSIENQVDPVAGEAVQTMGDIQKALAQAEEALIEIKHLAADYSADSDFGYQLATALNEFAATARSVRALTDMLQQQPDALLRGKGASGGK